MSNQDATHGDIQKTSLHRRSFPICPKCNQSCSNNNKSHDLVRAFNQVYHYSCFTCEDCQQPVADKYYPIECQQKNNRRKLVQCEYHHLKTLGLICLKCNQPITSGTTKSYHLECIQCPSCVTPTMSQYELKGTSYCRLHYSLLQETHCHGCDQAILKQFVEHRDLPNKIWHPECYMIYKFWSIKLSPKVSILCDSNQLVEFQSKMEQKITRVWTDLSSFEESSANCISDMLLNVAAGAYIEGIRMANQFIMHLDVLFSALDTIRHHLSKSNRELDCNTEAQLVCKQMIRFFELITIPTNNDTSITQELLSLVTGLAQNLKSLIRIGLSAALHLEREIGIENAIFEFLNQLLELEKKRVWIAGRYWFKDPPIIEGITARYEEYVHCQSCQLPISDPSSVKDFYQFQEIKWHPACFYCSTCSISLSHTTPFVLNNATLYCQSCCTTTQDAQNCTHVTILQQYLQNLKLYLTKLSTHNNSLNVSSTKHSSTNEIIMPETKRQRSILRMLGNNNTKPKSRLNSVNLGQVQRTSSTTLNLKPSTSSLFINSKQKNLVISTNTPLSSPTTLVESPVMVTPKSTNKLTNSIRRTFSTQSNNNNKRISLISVFDRKREGRRASILTIDNNGQPINKTLYLSCLTPMQDFTVRHVAIITIQPLIKPPFSLDELIDLIEIKKKKTSKKRILSTSTDQQQPSALWGKLLFHIKASHSTPTTSSINKTFGVPLSSLVEKKKKDDSVGVTLRDFTPTLAASFSDNALIPLFVKSCILAILQSDMSIEGVFRKNGNIRQLKILSEKIDTDITDVDQLLVHENSIQLAALLKRFLREMPEPLLTFSLYHLFVRCGKMISQEASPQEKKRLLHLACCLLPKENRDTMLLVFSCLKWVATFHDTNKMDIPNLARVIAPNVLYSNTNTKNTNADLIQEEIDVIETLIREADHISVVPSDLILLSIQDNLNQDVSDLNSRYFIKHYIQLLDELKRRKSTTTTKESENSVMNKLKYQIGVSKSPSSLNMLNNDQKNTPTTKQRRTSWIPGLSTKK